MTIDATFWVGVSFILFFGILIYLKVPQKINEILNPFCEPLPQIQTHQKISAYHKYCNVFLDSLFSIYRHLLAKLQLRVKGGEEFGPCQYQNVNE